MSGYLIKNLSESTVTLNGHEFQGLEAYAIEKHMLLSWGEDINVIDAIDNEDFCLLAGETELMSNTAIAILSNSFNSSVALDLNNTDQSLTGTDWVVVEASRIIWDLNEDFDLETQNFTIPFDGLYFSDIQIKIENILNVTAIEMAVFKRGTPDDYWFILDKKIINTETEVQLTGATLFDFYEGEEYCLKIKLYGTNPTATISGSDDYTAFGHSYNKNLYGV